jgi:hypothetical protein
MCGSDGCGSEVSRVVSPRDELLQISEWDCEWLFRSFTIYLCTDMPPQSIRYMRDMPPAIFIGRLEDALKRPEHPHTAALVTALLGSSKCDFSAKPYDTSATLTGTHTEYRSVLRKILCIKGPTFEHSEAIQMRILEAILKPREHLVRYNVDTLMVDWEHIHDFLNGDFQPGGYLGYYEIDGEFEPTAKGQKA